MADSDVLLRSRGRFKLRQSAEESPSAFSSPLSVIVKLVYEFSVTYFYVSIHLSVSMTYSFYFLFYHSIPAIINLIIQVLAIIKLLLISTDRD